jgi:uncharacterized protein (TIGR03435 family)
MEYPRVNLRTLLVDAFGLPRDQISGPAWVDTEWYSVMAVIAEGSDRDAVRQMLKGFLHDRFGLEYHMAKKTFPVYELIVTAAGPKLQPSPADLGPQHEPTTNYWAGAQLDRSGFPYFKPGARHAATLSKDGVLRSTYRSYSMDAFAAALGNELANQIGDGWLHPIRVLNLTGLAGAFDFTLEMEGTVAGDRKLEDSGPETGGPSIFAAVEKQLGLRLRKGGGEVLDCLVIDRANRNPSEN